MDLVVREMRLDEVDIRIDYFLNADLDYLQKLGVDPDNLPSRQAWLQKYEEDYARPVEQRESIQLLWLENGDPIGFSSADAIEFGEQAKMHLHVIEEGRRRSGRGVQCVRQSAKLYFAMLKLERLYCQPNAFNVAPNRTLQSAGFKYLKTHEITPSPINFHQAVTVWRLERDELNTFV